MPCPYDSITLLGESPEILRFAQNDKETLRDRYKKAFAEDGNRYIH